jgi:hypothetical protein
MLEPEDEAEATKKVVGQLCGGISGLGIGDGTAAPKPRVHQPLNNAAAVVLSVAVPAKEVDEERHGPKLGLGDFIFYSILMATVRCRCHLWNCGEKGSGLICCLLLV